jgi:hypothetical protein
MYKPLFLDKTVSFVRCELKPKKQLTTETPTFRELNMESPSLRCNDFYDLSIVVTPVYNMTVFSKYQI